MHMRSIYRDGWLCTAYEPSTGGRPTGLEKSPLIPEGQLERLLTPIEIQYDGTEGELYNVHEDPHHWRNLWADPDYASIRDDLVRDLYDSLPKTFNRLEVAAPA